MDAQKSTMTFYDIASGPPVHPFAPNPWKARYITKYPLLTFSKVPLKPATAMLSTLPKLPTVLNGSPSPTSPLPAQSSVSLHAASMPMDQTFQPSLSCTIRPPPPPCSRK
ncbi:MAG: hypothetical protein Q9180_009247, partial [Flavoplaca navasiana]